jgi:TRAP-type mannitol/chloroaromatic compound transport system substrate-binding protein
MSTQPQAADPQVPLSLHGESAEKAASVSGPTASDDRRATEWPYRDVDPRTGRLRPIPSEELQARYEELRRLLAEADAQDDTPEEVYDEAMRSIDEDRRNQGSPPAFEGCY